MTQIGGTGPGPGGIGAGESAVTALVIVALVPMGLLHVNGVGVIDPLDTTISDYVFLSGGYSLLGAAALALAAASLILAGGLRRAGLPRPGPATGLLTTGGVALVLVALFPTHEPGTTAGIVSTVHRLAGGWVFVAIPLAAWLVARQARTAPGRTSAAPLLACCAGFTGLLSLTFLLSHVPIVVGGSPGLTLIGGVERVLYAAVMLVLVGTARATRPAVDAARNHLAPVPAGAEVRGAA